MNRPARFSHIMRLHAAQLAILLVGAMVIGCGIAWVMLEVAGA